MHLKTAPNGSNTQTHIRTWQFYDWIGPVGPIQWKLLMLAVTSLYFKTRLVTLETSPFVTPGNEEMFQINPEVIKNSINFYICMPCVQHYTSSNSEQKNPIIVIQKGWTSIMYQHKQDLFIKFLNNQKVFSA